MSSCCSARPCHVSLVERDLKDVNLIAHPLARRIVKGALKHRRARVDERTMPRAHTSACRNAHHGSLTETGSCS